MCKMFLQHQGLTLELQKCFSVLCLYNWSAVKAFSCPLNLKERILETYRLSCRGWLKLFHFVLGWSLSFCTVIFQVHRVHCVKGRQSWVETILEWNGYTYWADTLFAEEESTHYFWQWGTLTQTYGKVSYIRATMSCLACKFKGKEMTAEDMARNVQFAKTFWRRKRRRKNTEMSLPSREKNSYPK